jgi:putative adhesin
MSNATFKALSLLALCGVAATAAAQEQRIVVPLSDPGRPARLEITLFMGDVEVRAYDGNEVIVTTDADVRNADEPEPARPDGLRRIQTSSVGMTVEENGNTVSVRMDFSPQGADLEVQVPRRTSVRASLVNGGDVEIEGLTGEHELSNVNGDVIAENVSGSAVMNSNNGDVRASFAQVDATKPMSFTSFNGDLDIALPANLAADLIVASQQGDVYTDFDVAAENDPASVDSDAVGGKQRWRMQRTTRYAIGGGGSDIQFRTFNGDIMIRKQ